MKILSVDIGIRNLGICIIEIIDKDLSYKILEWRNVCLCVDKEMTCEFMVSGKQNCKNKAKFIKNGTYFCKKHALKARNTLSQKDLDHHALESPYPCRRKGEAFRECYNRNK